MKATPEESCSSSWSPRACSATRGYDIRRDLLEVIGGMGVAYQEDLEAAGEGRPNHGADAHLREEAIDREAAHSRLSQQRSRVSPLEAVVATLS
jgi:hypothetical protein